MSKPSILKRLPLRTRLVASVLALFAAALLAIGVASSFALHSYLVARIDGELVDWEKSYRDTAAALANARPNPTDVVVDVVVPSTWFWCKCSMSGVGQINREVPPEKRPPLLHTVSEVEAHAGQPYMVTSADGTTRWRVLVTDTPEGVLYIGQSLTEVEHAVTRLIWVEVLIGAALLIVMSSAGAALIRANLRPLVEIEKTAAAIAAGDLTRRVPEYEPGDEPPLTEVGALSRALNTMLARIEQAFAASEHAESVARDAAFAAQRSEMRARRSEERMRRFAADASHELRTPLTTIRGFAELYRQGAARDPKETARLLRRIEDEASRMGLLVDDLLLLARLDQERPLEREPVDLRVVGAESVSAAAASAPDRTVDFDLAPGVGSLVVIGDELRLRQVVGNLMTNALAHTPPGTPVTLRLDGSDGFAELAVVDHGAGLTADQRDRVFERFYRVDSARGRPADGTSTGLGLAIVAALVSAHAGTVTVEETPGGGATFVVRLPLSAPSSDDDEMASVEELAP